MSTRIPREKAVFCQALEIADPEQRRQFLDQACGADQSLREQVERLLGLSQRAGDFFRECHPALEAAAADADPAQVPLAAASAIEAAPRESGRIGPYKLLQKLGEGGCGVVYMAEQEQPIRRRVALKIIKLGMDTKNVIARFEAERQALALMDHPNIARVLDAGATETGRPYFVMELVYGVKITDYCDQDRLGMRERLELFIQVCNAVQHAHQKGIIHRDLKPSNIMVTMRDGVPVPKVIDFGIAKATEQRLTDKTLFTSYAQLMGTPAYMSPEQMELSELGLDTRSDIYSLGVLLYELLTGRTPFDTANLLKSGIEELRRTVCEREPLSPSAKLQTLNNEELTKTARTRHLEAPRLMSQLRGDLDWIVLKCLEKDRTRRYATANGLAMDIEHYLNEETVLARPPSQFYRLQKLVRRNRIVFLLGAATATALLLGTIISTIMFVKEREARSSEARLRREAELREQASHVASLVTQGRFEEADKLVAGLPLDKPSLEVSSELRTLGDRHATNGQWPEAVARFEAVVKVNQHDPPDLVSEDQLKLGVAYLKSGNRPAYEEFRQSEVAQLVPTNPASDYWTFKLALLLPPHPNMLQLLAAGGEAVEKRFPNDQERRPSPPHAAQLSELMALLEYREGHFSKALHWGYRCEGYPVYNANPAAITSVSLIKALADWRSGNYQTAVVDWTAAVDLIQARSQQGLKFETTPASLFPGAPEDLGGPWHEWMIADLLMHECNELLAESDRTLGSVSGSNHGLRFTDWSFYPLLRALGEWHAINGEWDKARNRFEDVIELKELDNPRSLVDYYQEALTLLKLGDETGFARLRESALNRFKGTTNVVTARYAIEIESLRPADDTPAASLEPFVQVLTRAEAGAGPSNEGTRMTSARNLMVLGLSDYRRGNYAQALNWCRRSQDASPYDAIPTVQDQTIQAMSFHKLGDDPTARSELAKAMSFVQTGFNCGADSWNWRDWVSARLLLQEADSMIPQAPPSEPQK